VILTETPDQLRLESDRRLAISVVAILLCLNLAFVILNLKESGATNSIPPVVIVRLIGVAIAAVLTGALCAVRTQKTLGHIGFIGSIAVVLMLLWIHLQGQPVDSPAYAFDLVFITALFIAFPSSPPLQLIPATMLSIGAGALLSRPEVGISIGDKARYAFFFVSAIVLGYLAAHRRAKLWQDVIAARQAEWDAAVEADRAKSELQSLRGIIPICSHCHRVRIEDGRLWEDVAMYVSRRTDAAFSHGVCPDCLTVHYPNVRAE
jgi:hypothetical protein